MDLLLPSLSDLLGTRRVLTTRTRRLVVPTTLPCDSSLNLNTVPTTVWYVSSVPHYTEHQCSRQNIAREHMEKIKKKFPWISYGDLWTLGGVCAVQESGGPVVPWRPGRIDGFEHHVTPDGRLPDASKAEDHLRSIFYRMGWVQALLEKSATELIIVSMTRKSLLSAELTPWDDATLVCLRFCMSCRS